MKGSANEYEQNISWGKASSFLFYCLNAQPRCRAAVKKKLKKKCKVAASCPRKKTAISKADVEKMKKLLQILERTSAVVVCSSFGSSVSLGGNLLTENFF